MSERLTKRKDYGCACWNGDQNLVTHRRYSKMLEALAQYEDAIFDADGNEVISLDRLRELASAEREELIYILPDCKTCANKEGNRTCGVCVGKTINYQNSFYEPLAAADAGKGN